MLIGAHHTGLTVIDLERSIQFYTGLGLEVVMRQESAAQYLRDITGFPDALIKMAHLSVPGGGHRLELFEYVSPPGRPMRPRTCDPGSTHLCFLVDDLAATYQQLVDQGVRFVSGPITVNAGVNTGGRGLYLRDPDGFTVELFQPPS
jgi:catechol 2,3-dioxygenase-like lactoylglutathione lyase family enzyme